MGVVPYISDDWLGTPVPELGWLLMGIGSHDIVWLATSDNRSNQEAAQLIEYGGVDQTDTCFKDSELPYSVMQRPALQAYETS